MGGVLASLRDYLWRIAKWWWALLPGLALVLFDIYQGFAPPGWPTLALSGLSAIWLSIGGVLVAAFLVFHEDRMSLAASKKEPEPEPDIRLDAAVKYLVNSSIWIKRLRECGGGATRLHDDLRSDMYLGKLTVFGRPTQNGMIPSGFNLPFQIIPQDHWADHMADVARLDWGEPIDNCAADPKTPSLKTYYDIHLCRHEVYARWRPLNWRERWKYPPAKGGVTIAVAVVGGHQQ